MSHRPFAPRQRGRPQPAANTCEKLDEYLNEMIESPERRREITAALEEHGRILDVENQICSATR